MFRHVMQFSGLAAVLLVATAMAAGAQVGRTDPLGAASPTVPAYVGGNAAHGLCPVVVRNGDGGPVIEYRQLPPC